MTRGFHGPDIKLSVSRLSPAHTSQLSNSAPDLAIQKEVAAAAPPRALAHSSFSYPLAVAPVHTLSPCSSAVTFPQYRKNTERARLRITKFLFLGDAALAPNTSPVFAFSTDCIISPIKKGTLFSRKVTTLGKHFIKKDVC